MRKLQQGFTPVACTHTTVHHIKEPAYGVFLLKLNSLFWSIDDTTMSAPTGDKPVFPGRVLITDNHLSVFYGEIRYNHRQHVSTHRRQGCPWDSPDKISRVPFESVGLGDNLHQQEHPGGLWWRTLVGPRLEANSHHQECPCGLWRGILGGWATRTNRSVPVGSGGGYLAAGDWRYYSLPGDQCVHVPLSRVYRCALVCM